MEDLYKRELITCEEMKQLEQMADQRGLSYHQMMENAGCGAANLIFYYRQQMKRAVIFCGKGNNGGDGFVIARNFLEVDFETIVVLVEGPPVTEDARKSFRLIEKRAKIFDRSCPVELRKEDVIVDAIFGTGFHGDLTGFAAEAVEMINRSEAFTASLDIPSGLSGNMSGEIGELPPSVKADLTVAFHCEKPVHRCEKTEERMGDIVICDIGITTIFEESVVFDYEDNYGDL